MTPSLRASRSAAEPVAYATGFAGGGGSAPTLVLAHGNDETALAVAALLRQRHGDHAVAFRTVEEVLAAPCWDHRISASGVTSEIVMHDGARLGGRASSVIFNRVGFVDPPHFHNAAPADRDYARMELLALLLSWLADPGCPVVNRPAPGGLSGAMHRPLTWSRLAQIAGLTPLAMMATSSTRRFPSARDAVRRPDLSYTSGMFDGGPARPNDFSWFTAPGNAGQLSLLAIGGRIPQDAPPDLVEPCRRLAQLADTDILRIDLVASSASPTGWAFARADSCPHISDPDSLVRVARLLETSAAQAAASAS